MKRKRDSNEIQRHFKNLILSHPFNIKYMSMTISAFMRTILA